MTDPDTVRADLVLKDQKIASAPAQLARTQAVIHNFNATYKNNGEVDEPLKTALELENAAKQEVTAKLAGANLQPASLPISVPPHLPTQPK